MCLFIGVYTYCICIVQAAATGASMAKRNYPTSEVRGSGCDGVGTTEKSYPSLRSGAATERSYPASEVRGVSREELPHAPMPEARGGGQEELLHAGGQGRRR